MEVKKILCAVDLEDTIAPSVEYAKMMASMTGASILVAYVIPAHTPYEDVYLSVNNQPNEVNNPNETIQKSMNALLAEQFAGMDATGVILVGRPSEELVKLAEEDPTFRTWTDEETGQTTDPRIWAGGDIVTGAATVILAMGAGKKAAASITKSLLGE